MGEQRSTLTGRSHTGRHRGGEAQPRLGLAAEDRYWVGERRAGALLVAAAVAAVAWASSPWSASYGAVWSHPARAWAFLPRLGDVRSWVDGGAMTLFFFVVGLEIGRERAVGALASWQRALLPVVGALGGMAGAAVVYTAVVHGGRGSNGWGVPMATDIALVAGMAALLGQHVPPRLRLFLVALAAADDVTSVVVLAVVSGRSVSVGALGVAGVVVAVLAVGRRRWRSAWPVVVALVPLWLALARAGVEPALAGALAGALVPVGALDPPGSSPPPAPPAQGTASGGAPSRRPLTGPTLEGLLHPVSATFVLPLFAVANVGVDLRRPLLVAPGAAAVFAGVVAARVVGKTAGIALASRGAFASGRAPRSERFGPGHLMGGAALCGAGFTVPLLFAAVAFAREPGLLQAASAALLTGSVLAAGLGAVALVLTGRHRRARAPDQVRRWG